MNAVPVWNNATVLAVLIGIVAFSMYMGSRSGRHGRKAGWWSGLVVLLVILSAFFGFASFRMRGVVEERHASRPPFARDISTPGEEIDRAMQEAQLRGEEAAEK